MSSGQAGPNYRISDAEMGNRIENELYNAAKEAEKNRYQGFPPNEWNSYYSEDSNRHAKKKESIFNNKFVLTPIVIVSLLICYWTFAPLIIDMSNDTGSINGWGELKSDTAYFSDVKVVEHIWLIGERGFFTKTYDVQVLTDRTFISVESVSEDYMNVLVDRYWTSGVSSTNSVSVISSQSNPNQEVIDEYNAYSSQYKIRVDAFNEDVNTWNTKLTAYNDYIAKVNAMSYATRTSSATQNELNLKATEVRSAGRNLQVECAVFETHINDMLAFMEENKNSLKDYNSQMYMQQKSFLVEQKARCETTEETVNNILNKLD
jgi:uncharacterized protein YeaO (DUF488 family)